VLLCVFQFCFLPDILSINIELELYLPLTYGRAELRTDLILLERNRKEKKKNLSLTPRRNGGRKEERRPKERNQGTGRQAGRQNEGERGGEAFDQRWMDRWMT